MNVSDAPKQIEGQPIEHCLLTSLVPYSRNAKEHSDEQVALLVGSLHEFGWTRPILIDESSMVLAGHGMLAAAFRAQQNGTKIPGWADLSRAPCVRKVGLSPAQKRAYVLADNRLTELSTWNFDLVRLELGDLNAEGFDIALTGFGDLSFSSGKGSPEVQPGRLFEKFLVPPFSVLNARDGWWQDRKRAWLSLGIQSEVGRGGNLLKFSETAVLAGRAKKPERLGKVFGTEGNIAGDWTGTSIFDPVICEIAYRWFSPVGGRVLDPFAGGSVRGIVAAALRRAYVGVDLRGEQIAANREQWRLIGPKLGAISAPPPQDNQPELTPVERRGDIWLKRDDLFSVAGVQGGKVRTCWTLAQGATGLITAGSRQSPQANIVAQIARRLGIPCRIHCPSGDLGPEVTAAHDAGAEITQHGAGHNPVIIARARADAKETGWREIPFGMECEAAVLATATQVANLPAECKRLVVPVGSGMSLAGILRGLAEAGRDIPILAVQVGADPRKRLDKFAPGWRDRVKLVKSPLDYHALSPQTEIQGVSLDPIYEAKAIPYVQPGDCLWVVGIRQTALRTEAGEANTPAAPAWIEGDSTDVATLAPAGPYDLIFSCPPYGDLEQYSDDPRDLSVKDWPEFLASYRQIIKATASLLAHNRFAVFVVGEIRDERGAYRNLVGETVRAFIDAGLTYYNETILVTALGSVPIRAERQFVLSRKVGKTHQNVLVFCKGDGAAAASACGTVDVADAIAAVIEAEQAAASAADQEQA